MSGESSRPSTPPAAQGRLDIPRALLDAIYQHAREGYPEEVCGFIVADDEVKRCENRQNALHAEDPVSFPRDAKTAYNIGAKDIHFMDKSLRTDRPVRVIYHSHVDVGAYFSAEDVRAATFEGEPLYPVDYLVVDVTATGVRGSKLFRFSDGSFVEIGSHGA